MSTHTPGPWTLNSAGGCYYYIQTEGGGDVAEVVRPIPWPDALRPLADARLIAAAPDLLAALQPFANFACSPPGDCQCHNCRARDAIAAATGTQQEGQSNG